MARRSKAPLPGAKRGRKPLLENRPDRDELLAELISPGANLAGVSRRIGVSEDALQRFRDKWIPLPIRNMLARVGDRALEAAQLDVLSRFMDSAEKSYEMLKAADLWLRDPDDSGRYNLNPRTHEVDIVYEQTIGKVTVRKTEKLSKLMRDVEDGLGISVVKGETRIADPRKLLLEAAATMRPILEVYGKQTGQIKPDPAANVNVTVLLAQVEEIKAAFVEAGCERCSAALDARLAAIEKARGGA